MTPVSINRDALMVHSGGLYVPKADGESAVTKPVNALYTCEPVNDMEKAAVCQPRGERSVANRGLDGGEALERLSELFGVLKEAWLRISPFSSVLLAEYG